EALGLQGIGLVAVQLIGEALQRFGRVFSLFGHLVGILPGSLLGLPGRLHGFGLALSGFGRLQTGSVADQLLLLVLQFLRDGVFLGRGLVVAGEFGSLIGELLLLLGQFGGSLIDRFLIVERLLQPLQLPLRVVLRSRNVLLPAAEHVV